jgi:hypothetical protein
MADLTHPVKFEDERIEEVLKGLTVRHPEHVIPLLEVGLAVAISQLSEDIEIRGEAGHWNDMAAYAREMRFGGEKVARLAGLLAERLEKRGGV